jgi:hypothetical protein
MLISTREQLLHLVPQREHARVAGAMAAAWGNEQFPPSSAPASLTIAATRHDDGWRQLDDAPLINAEEGRPAHFLEVPITVSAGPYGEGVDAIYEQDLRAGVLASMHRSGLWASRWGIDDAPPVDNPLAREVVAYEDGRIAAGSRALWEAQGGLRSAFQAELWRDYETLQALDLLSLALSLLDTSAVSDPTAGAPLMSSTLRPLRQAPGARLIECVPAGGGAHHVDLRLEVIEPGLVAIDPFPFAVSEVALALTARVLPARPLGDARAVSRAYHAAEPVTSAVALVPAAREPS